MQFRSKAVLLSHGGRQELHPDFYKHFSCMQPRKDRVILSDTFLKRSRVLEHFRFIQDKKVKKVVIIGGSHSGFSAAWLLLNGPADIHNNAHAQCRYKAFPGAVFKTIADCSECCSCLSKKKNCGCVCICFGFFKYQNVAFDYSLVPKFGIGDIKILYRNNIKVFYKKVHMARADGYKEFSST